MRHTRLLAPMLALATSTIACRRREEPAPPPAVLRPSTAPPATPPTPAPAAGSAWATASSTPGVKLDAAARAGTPSVAVGRDGATVVAWMEASNVHVKRLAAGAWTVVGGGPVNTRAGRATDAPSLATDAGGAVVAWVEMNGDDRAEVRVRREAGGSWSPDAAPVAAATPGQNLDAPRIVASAGGAVLLWRERGPERTVLRARQWRDGAWAPLGESLGAAPPARVEVFALASKADGAPVVAWVERSGSGARATQLRRWDTAAGAWSPLPSPPLEADGGTTTLALVAAPDGALYAGCNFNAGLRPVARLPEGASSWSVIGLPAVRDVAQGPFLAPLGSGVALAWRADRLLAARWRDGAWSSPSAPLDGAPQTTHDVSMAGASDGLRLAWLDRADEGYGIRVASLRATAP